MSCTDCRVPRSAVHYVRERRYVNHYTNRRIRSCGVRDWARLDCRVFGSCGCLCWGSTVMPRHWRAPAHDLDTPPTCAVLLAVSVLYLCTLFLAALGVFGVAVEIGGWL